MAGHSNRRIKSDRLLAEKIWGSVPEFGENSWDSPQIFYA